MKMLKINIIGLGYVGLPTFLLLSSKKFEVTGYDIDDKKIQNIKKFKSSKFETQIKKLIAKLLIKKKLKIKNKITPSDVYIICVPTPIKKIGNLIKPDLQPINGSINQINKFIKTNDTVIIESTIPIGTTNLIRNKLMKNKPNDFKINIAYSPERVLPGKVIKELIHNDRIIGIDTNKTKFLVKKIYNSFVKGNIKFTNIKTAEMVKLAENSFRDLNIAFANEISVIAKKNKINVNEVIKIANYHPRVNIHSSGIGVGGHCIPVDPWFLIFQNPKDTKLLETSRKINDYKPNIITKDILKNILNFKKQYNFKPTISLFGFTYKADVNDFRNSPSIKIYKKLLSKKIKPLIVDPYINSEVELKSTKIKEAIKKSDLIFILVRHKVFLKHLKKTPKNKKIIDYTS